MSQPSRMTAKKFHEQPGVGDWRVLFWGAYAHYVTDSLAHAVELVAGVASIAAELGHEPDLDVRTQGVTIRTFSNRDGSLSATDAELARLVSEWTTANGYRPDPSKLMVTQLAVAQDAGADTRPFWAAVLGYEPLGDGDMIDPQRRNPVVWTHELTPPKPGRGRTHLDVSLPADIAEARIAAAVAAGGRVVVSKPEWTTIASPENHGVDIASWADFEDYS
jgi:4a-hydroxytetrahydrobiopterin dehydratase